MIDLPTFPCLSKPDFQTSITHVRTLFAQHAHTQTAWTSVQIIQASQDSYLRITKPLQIGHATPATLEDEFEVVEENDDQTLHRHPTAEVEIHYDIVLSPTYRVPALYFYIADPLHRFPPTIDTLYRHIIPPQFANETRDVGVLGGVTITDHPITSTPVYFIHPCRTADALLAAAGPRPITAEDYLVLWIGALGRCVGLDVPLELIVAGKDESDHRKERDGER